MTLLSCGLLLVSGFTLARAQIDHPALILCQQQKYSEAMAPLTNAVRSKEHRNDGRLWNCLGLARYQTSDDKAALKAFETAIRFEPTNSAYRVNLAHVLLMRRKIDAAQRELGHVLKTEPTHPEALYLLAISDSWEGKVERAIGTAEQLIGLHPTLSSGYILKADLLVQELGSDTGTTDMRQKGAEVLRNSVEVLRLAQSRVTDPEGAKQIETELNNKQIFAEYLARDSLTGPSAPVTPEPGVTPLKITYKQKAQYTDRARTSGVQGSIVIAVLFGADGRIANTLLIKRLGYGLDENAIRAARAMRFEPQKKDGNPVSVVRLVSYTFNIY
jgi:TonB family protein